MIAEESPDTARLRYTEALFFSNFTTCGDPNPTCCTDWYVISMSATIVSKTLLTFDPNSVGNWCDGCESAWHVSLKCCPGNAETITADYKHVFWAALAVTILVSIAFLSVPWVLFFSTPPPGKWVPTSEAGFRTTTIARCRAFLLGDPVATRRVRVSHVSKERLGTLLGSRYTFLKEHCVCCGHLQYSFLVLVGTSHTPTFDLKMSSTQPAGIEFLLKSSNDHRRYRQC